MQTGPPPSLPWGLLTDPHQEVPAILAQKVQLKPHQETLAVLLQTRPAVQPQKMLVLLLRERPTVLLQAAAVLPQEVRWVPHREAATGALPLQQPASDNHKRNLPDILCKGCCSDCKFVEAEAFIIVCKLPNSCLPLPDTRSPLSGRPACRRPIFPHTPAVLPRTSTAPSSALGIN